MEMIEVEAFVAIARSGSFTRAAESLYLSQPAISRRIELLEQELGARLFERHAGGARLTEAGDAFLPFAEQILAATLDGREAVRAVEEEEQGTVALAIVGTLASTGLTETLRRFREAYPLIRLTLHTGRSDDVSALVRHGEVSLGLRYFVDPHPDVISERVNDEPLLPVAARQSRLVPDRARRASDLAGIPWVAFPATPGTGGEPYTRLLSRQLQATALDGAEIVTIDSLTAQKRLVEADFGVALVPESAIQEELRLGTLRVLEIPELVSSAPVTVIRRRQGYLSRAARRLLEEITASTEDRQR